MEAIEVFFVDGKDGIYDNLISDAPGAVVDTSRNPFRSSHTGRHRP